MDAAGVTGDELVARLLRAGPRLEEAWSAHRVRWEGGPAGNYNDISVIAHGLVAAEKALDHQTVAAILDEVEHLLDDLANGAVRDLLTTGLIEDVQNTCSHESAGLGSSRFLPYLGPRTTAEWRAMHERWGTSDT
jgi:hypothetical protein